MSTQTLRTGGIAAGRDYQELPAWQKAITLAERAYKLTESFPEREHNGLAASLRAAAARVPSHVAAASGKQNEQGMLNSYFDAQAASAELATLATLAERLGYLGAEDATAFAAARDEVNRLVTGLKHGMKVEAKDSARKERDEAKAEREYQERKPRRDFDKPRGDRDERPRREYKPRDGDERPRREYKPRDGGDERPRREYADKKPYGDKKPYEKKAYGDKKPYGDRKPYGDKKPYGDRKPRGEGGYSKGPRKSY